MGMTDEFSNIHFYGGFFAADMTEFLEQCAYWYVYVDSDSTNYTGHVDSYCQYHTISTYYDGWAMGASMTVPYYVFDEESFFDMNTTYYYDDWYIGFCPMGEDCF